MTDYRRHYAPGGTCFFTVNLENRTGTLLTDNIESLRQAFRQVSAEHPFTLVAIVVLPEHLHAIWVLPDGDADFSMRWKKIKAKFSRQLPPGEPVSASKAEKGERGIWQRRFREHLIRDGDDLRRHVDYIHFNPVKHGHCQRVADWPHSSFHRHVKEGVYSADWAGAHEEPNINIPD